MRCRWIPISLKYRFGGTNFVYGLSVTFTNVVLLLSQQLLRGHALLNLHRLELAEAAFTAVQNASVNETMERVRANNTSREISWELAECKSHAKKCLVNITSLRAKPGALFTVQQCGAAVDNPSLCASPPLEIASSCLAQDQIEPMNADFRVLSALNVQYKYEGATEYHNRILKLLRSHNSALLDGAVTKCKQMMFDESYADFCSFLRKSQDTTPVVCPIIVPDVIYWNFATGDSYDGPAIVQAMLCLDHEFAETFVTVLKNTSVNIKHGAYIWSALRDAFEQLTHILTGKLHSFDCFMHHHKRI